MAETDEPQFTTLAERIAALNKQKNFSAPPPGAGKRAPPQPPTNRPVARAPGQATSPVPPRENIHVSPPEQAAAVVARPSKPGPPPLPQRTQTAPVNGVNGTSPSLSRGLAPPPLPSRRSTEQTSPALPARQPSTQSLSVRRNSNSSDVSHISNVSSLSLNLTTSASSVDGQPARKLPPTFDQTKLPPLPPSKREQEARAKEKAAREVKVPVKAPLLPSKSAPVVPRVEAARPSLPPRLPSRPARSPGIPEDEESAPSLPTRRLPPPGASYVKPVPEVSGNTAKGTPASITAPPVPVASRPTSSQAHTAVTHAHAAPGKECLICRDFSAPDSVAAQYPSQSLPRQDPVGYLAQVLCDPFPSLTDKARAIFTWCHHNIAYDVEGFFGGCITRGTPGETIFSGKAVCEGYARVYEAIALRAGLECMVVGGHGKGYGYTPLKKGERPPPRNATGHAWNAVCIDGGEWKLLDACWGAGSVGNQQYNKHFTPAMFTLSNELFGLKHFPEDDRNFFRSDGRMPSWEEYIVGPVQGEPATWYNDANEEGLSEFAFAPRERQIPVYSGETVRFQFSKICEHWRPEKHGRGRQMLFLLKVNGLDGRKEDMVPLDTDGFWWWTDVPARELGCQGQKVSLLGVTQFDGRSARGLTKKEYLAKKGRVGMSFCGIAAWDLV